jgi:hypothetical protein
MHVVSTLLGAALPWLSSHGHSVIEGLVTRRGYSGSAHRFAIALGMKNRFQLARHLEREGMPCLEDLAGWIRVLIWTVEWESSRQSLSRSALSAIQDPAPCYRTVERITGLGWMRIRRLGSTWVLLALIERCQPPNITVAQEEPAQTAS